MGDQDSVGLCFPELLNSSCRKPTLSWSELVLLNFLWSFVSLITAVLNLLVIISVCHFRKLHTPTNILLLSLAVSDFLVGLVLMPGEIFRNTGCWILGDIMCSLITLTGVKRCVCLCWLCAAVYSIIYVKDELIQPGRSNSCVGECTFYIGYITGTVDLVLNFVFPVTVIVVLYMRVFVVAVSQARAMRSRITVVAVRCAVTSKKSELKAARTLGVLVVVYLLCFCPYYGYSLFEVNVTGTSYASVLVFIFYLNSCLNPLIYAFFYPWFRKAMRFILTLQILQPGSCETNIL
ncbi:trace amine-associated receptor 13c-like [Menidia menidia]